jgi:ABC-type bacteriocin/lantibiotic exporter with double-glycine peptidase domain
MSLLLALLIGLVIYLLTGSLLWAVIVVLLLALVGFGIDQPYGYRRRRL